MLRRQTVAEAEISEVLTCCRHKPPCPPATAPDHTAARIVALHPEQGWSLLCNGVVLFEDTGELLPDGRVIQPHRPNPTPAVPLVAGRRQVADRGVASSTAWFDAPVDALPRESVG
jgi:hypothetical protein